MGLPDASKNNSLKGQSTNLLGDFERSKRQEQYVAKVQAWRRPCISRQSLQQEIGFLGDRESANDCQE